MTNTQKTESQSIVQEPLTLDKQLVLILQEYKSNSPDVKEKRGRPPELTSEKFVTLINSFQNGLDREEACRAARFGVTTFYSYMNKSEEFRKAIERAEDFPNVAAEAAIVKSIVGTPSRKMNVLDNKGNLVTIDTAEIPPDITNAKWWLERVKKGRFAASPIVDASTPLLGAPKNEEEASVMAHMFKSIINHAKRTGQNNKD